MVIQAGPDRKNFVSGENKKSSRDTRPCVSTLLKSLQCTEVTNHYDIIHDTTPPPIIFIREAITILLMQLGYKVNAVSSVEEALDLQSNKAEPCLKEKIGAAIRAELLKVATGNA